MRVYVGQTRAAELVRRLWLMGIGECTARGELPPRRRPWFYDNGAYSDWTAAMRAAYGSEWETLLAADPKKYPPVQAKFDRAQYVRDLDGIFCSLDRPDFIVLPDIVAGGLASLEESRRWIHRCRGLAPLYLAVQDGMKPEDVADERLVAQLAGLFVGGSLKWKIQEGEKWVEHAHAHGLRCHIGRVGAASRVRWAMRIGADSIDSCLPLFSEENLNRFLRALDPPQRELLMGAA